MTPRSGNVESIRRPLVAANWKMNKTNEEADAFLARFLPAISQRRLADVTICPPFTALRTVVEHTLDSGLRVAAQNVHEAPEGPFTGEISVPMLLELGVSGAVLGHSERRQHFNETDGALQRKLPVVLEAGLTPILCVGETEDERDAGETERKLRQQVQSDLTAVNVARLPEVVIAYEPIWAIGTGRTATPEQAQAAIGFVRALVSDRDAAASKAVRVLYGGSVDAANAPELMALEDVDGALVGGASLSPDRFLSIAAAARP
jgi:triosephosphate isomerase (TIM)